MHIFYLPEATEGYVNLPEEESKHCVRVLRLEAGDKMLVTNGKGNLYDAILIDAHPKKAIAELSVPKKGYDHWPFHLHIAIAPTKNIERLEWFLEKGTEIGVDEISLFTSFHSERRIVKTERLEKIMIAAMKQSLKSRLPKLNNVVSFEKFVKSNRTGQKFIAWIDDKVKENLIDVCLPETDCTIIIGPEGDFSQDEVKLAIENGFKPISLGKARLRTETAALASCQTVQMINYLNK
ncbi:MAG: 16S rRNA (uracil(1498)-N(3))-methyltransferase [Bacteroidales bacterium]|nr:16S rRNA (uracil(1498)-N(3))-methyltransferase [Bacteroidales bacterium]